MSEKRTFYLREWRIYRGLTQEQLGNAVGVTKGRISEYERGEEGGGRRYNETFLSAAADALGCAPWQLLGQDPSAPDGLGEIVDIWDHILERDKPQAKSILKTFTAKKGG